MFGCNRRVGADKHNRWSNTNEHNR